MHPLQDALGTVRILRRSLLGRQRFKGWSGPTRMASGTLALLASLGLHWIGPVAGPYEMTLVWGGVFLGALLLNLGALVYWFWNDRAVERDVQRLRPILDVMPPLAVGALFTFLLLWRREFDPLYGVWMCMFGLTNLASRYVVPASVALVGVFYILAGGLCLMLPGITFHTPLAMGAVFCVGEWASGLFLYRDDRRYEATIRELSFPTSTEPEDPHAG